MTGPEDDTDTTDTTEISDAESSVDAPTERRGTPAAQAASRARRIGGRPSPSPSSVPAAQAATPAPSPTGRTRPKPTPAPDAAPKRPKPGPKRSISTASTAEAGRRAKPRTDRQRPPIGTWLPAAILAVVLVALVVLDLSWLGGLQHPGGHQASTTSADREKLLSQAKTKVALVSSYNYQHIDADAKAAEAGMVEPFKGTYDKSIQTVIKPLAAQVKAIVTCSIQTAGITSVSGDGKQAVVLIYAQLSTENSTTNGQPRLDIATIQVTMNKQGSNWMISQLARE
jgi:hypothetical protein